MKLKIEPVNSKNWRRIVQLKVAANQNSFIETTSQCLLEAAYDKQLHWQPFGLRTDDEFVGFAMIGAFNEQAQTVWLDRFMIDKRYQHQGLGGYFLDNVLSLTKSQFNPKQIYLSIHSENQVAAVFYLKHGFKDANQIDSENGESIYYYSC